MRILLVEDHKPTREEMRALLERQADMLVVAEAETGEAAIERARESSPDVIVMDILLPGMNGVEATRKIRQASPDAKVLALSNHFGNSVVEAFVAAGGLGYVRKSRAFEELVPAVRAVAAGQSFVTKAAGDRAR